MKPSEYKPRTTKPEAGNKYYNTKANGGYSTAIVGKPTDKGCNVLANCFTGYTRIVTRCGLQRLDDLVDKKIEILTEDGEYHEAVGGYYGKQETYFVTLKNRRTFECSGNHRWLVMNYSNRGGDRQEIIRFKTTEELKTGDYIPYVENAIICEDEDGVRHGFIYGDGSYYSGHNHSLAALCGEKRYYMGRYFEGAPHSNIDSRGVLSYYPYPAHYKELPDISADLEYLKGFVMGLIASDGCVDRYGCPAISTVNKECAYFVNDVLYVLGIISQVTLEVRDTNFKENSELYRVIIKKNSIDASYFINPVHRARFEAKNRGISYTRVESVTPTGDEKPMYCVSEPVTTTMVLEGGIVTGQCVGYAFGRFNEIGGNSKMDWLQPVNAENFYQVAINQGFTVSQAPSLGAVAVWQKGPTLSSSDGAGHVAIVEKIYSETQILTSESGYNCSNPFWTQVRNKGDGNWGGGVGYKFLGFIKNPAVDDDPKCPYKTPTRVLKLGANGEDVMWLQWMLKYKGYLYDPNNNQVDGDFGVYTLGALLAFQLQSKLEVDGCCGPATRKALSK